MTHYLATHGDTIAAAFLGLVALGLAVWSLLKLGCWSDRRQVRLIHAPTCPIAADESVTRVLGWADPFATTRREIAALSTQEIA